MARQKLNAASGSPVNCAGNFAGSGSRPTQTSESACSQRVRNACMKLIVDPCSTRGSKHGSKRCSKRCSKTRGRPSVRLAVLVEVTELAVDATKGQVVVGIDDAVLAVATTDLDV